MDICFSLALTSALLLRLPGPVTLSWEHSVEHFRIEEVWLAGIEGLELREVRTGGFGAGVHVPDSARMVEGQWRFAPSLPPQRQVQLANSRHVRGYRVCWPGGCAALSDLPGAADRAVTMSACPDRPAAVPE